MKFFKVKKANNAGYKIIEYGFKVSEKTFPNDYVFESHSESGSEELNKIYNSEQEILDLVEKRYNLTNIDWNKETYSNDEFIFYSSIFDVVAKHRQNSFGRDYLKTNDSRLPKHNFNPSKETFKAELKVVIRPLGKEIQSTIQQPNKPKPTTMLPDNMQWAWDPEAADWVAVLKDNNNTTPPLYDPSNQNVVNQTTNYTSTVKSASKKVKSFYDIKGLDNIKMELISFGEVNDLERFELDGIEFYKAEDEELENAIDVCLEEEFMPDWEKEGLLSYTIDSIDYNEEDKQGVVYIDLNWRNDKIDASNKQASCLSKFLDSPQYSKEIKIEAGLIKNGLVKYAGFDFNRGTKYAITTKGLEVLRRASEAEHNEALNEQEKLAYMFGFNTNKETTLDTTGKVIKSDELSKCEWCGEEFDESELEDTELGKVCYRCKKGIESKEGPMNNKNISEAKQYLEKYLLENPELFKYQYGKDNVEEVLKELIEENPNWYKKFSSKKWTICEADGTPLGKVTASSELDAKVKFGIEHPEYADSQSISAKEIKSAREPGRFEIRRVEDYDYPCFYIYDTLKQKPLVYDLNGSRRLYYLSYTDAQDGLEEFENLPDSKELNAQYEQTTNTKEPYPNPSETPHDDIVLENHDGWVNTAEQKVTPEFAQLHSILGEYKKNGHILSITQDGKDLLVSCSPIASYEMKQKFEQLGYECEETDESETGDAYDLPSYTLRIKMK